MPLIYFIKSIVCRLSKMAYSLPHEFLNAKMNRFGRNLSSPQIHKLSTPRIHSDIEGIPSRTSDEQVKVEGCIERLFEMFLDAHGQDLTERPQLQRSLIVDYLSQGLSKLSQSYECLDASRTWICYWTLHALELLNVSVTDEIRTAVISFIDKCQNTGGGYGGGPLQYSHLAPTYASINALVILGAYESIDRESLYNFLRKCRNDEGAFSLHIGGEVDVRGTYCAIVVAKLTNIYDEQLFKNTGDWLIRCQTYEGGFGGCPYSEAHGGYTFCALAALTLLGYEKKCNIRSLLRWASSRQMKFEGGFQGRTNKLVDGCYSFWQGALFPLLQFVFAKTDQYSETLNTEKWLFNQEALQEYLLICCQHPMGGLLDKPDRPRDFYHTCYGLSGLSVSQHVSSSKTGRAHIIGSPENELALLHPIYNIGLQATERALSYFGSKPLSH